MPCTFVHLQLFFSEEQILEAAKRLFQHAPGVELVDLFRSPCSIGELLRGITLSKADMTIALRNVR